jgi:hypothetical protein
MTALHMARRSRWTLLIVAAVALQGCMLFMKPPADPKAYEHTQASAAQMYRATFTPAEPIKVTTADGTPVDSAKLMVDGGMPQHGHGLPTKPLVTGHLGDGKHVVEGMKFNMGGWWVVKLTIDGAKGSDVVTFNLKL